LISQNDSDNGDWVVFVLELTSEEASRVEDFLFNIGAISIELVDANLGSKDEVPIFDSVQETDAGWADVELLVTFPSSSQIEGEMRRSLSLANIAWSSVTNKFYFDNEDWVGASQRQFPTTKVTDEFWIVPSWKAKELKKNFYDSKIVVIDPGGAFGTGTHPTTLLCLKWLVRHSQKLKSVMDYGCGSGILAIAAKKLGASTVTAVDLDPDALQVTASNARINGVEVLTKSAKNHSNDQCDLLIANILTNPLVVLAPIFALILSSGGTLILSGVMTNQKDQIIEAFSGKFRFLDTWELDDWLLLVAKRF
tara:strand:- start:79 stop:1005 length:927 start_codon:yes stop_codon:yes gene_type:complete